MSAFTLDAATVAHINDDGGLCGTCCRPAAATSSNEGYSSCCNDRIEYGSEALDSLRRALAEEVAEAGLQKIEYLGSWGQVEKTGWITREGTYTTDARKRSGGAPIAAVWAVDENGYEGVLHLSQEDKNYGFRRVQS